MSEAQEVLDTAVANQPNKGINPLASCWRGCFIAVLLLALPVWWFCLHTTPLRVSKETTYVLGPMTSDGKRIDYFLAMEERYYPPEMKTDDNGFRLVVRTIGAIYDVEHSVPEPLRLQIYEKLGLDPSIEPVMKPIESPWRLISEYDKEHPPTEGEKSLYEKYRSLHAFWTFEGFPMFKDWLEENTAGIDMLAEAVRKPAFYIPLIRENENTPILESVMRLTALQWIRDWARAIHTRTQYRLGIGDIDGAIDDIVTLHRLARHAGKQGTFVSGFLGMAIEGMAVSVGIGSNPEFQPTKEQIERLVRELDALPPRLTLVECLESERYFGLASLQDMYRSNILMLDEDDDPFPYYRLLLPGMKWTYDINIAMKRLNEVYDALFDVNVLDGFRKPSGNPYNPFPLLFVRSRTNRIMDFFVASVTPGWSGAHAGEWWRRIECLENVQRLTLALLLYEKEHGGLPEGDWREAIRPYLGEEADKYFQCPGHRLAQGETNYAMIGGVENGVDSPHRILIVEIMQPQKLGEGGGRLSLEKAQFGDKRDKSFDGLGSYHAGGMNVGFRSGGTRLIVENVQPEVLQGLLDGTATALP